MIHQMNMMNPMTMIHLQILHLRRRRVGPAADVVTRNEGHVNPRPGKQVLVGIWMPASSYRQVQLLTTLQTII